jgi:hypothetical protein
MADETGYTGIPADQTPLGKALRQNCSGKGQ